MTQIPDDLPQRAGYAWGDDAMQTWRDSKVLIERYLVDANLGPFSPGDRVEVLTNRYDPKTTISQYWRPAVVTHWGKYVTYVDYGNHTTRVDTARLRKVMT